MTSHNSFVARSGRGLVVATAIIFVVGALIVGTVMVSTSAPTAIPIQAAEE
jgi:hypothetical protein